MRWLVGAALLLGGGVLAEVLTETNVLLPTATVAAKWLAEPIKAPLGVMISLPMVGAWLYAFRRWRADQPRLEHYTRDKIGGVLWEWAWQEGTPSPRLEPICPRCFGPMRVEAEVAHAEDGRPPSDRASCDCGFERTIGIGGNYLTDLFRVEVERRVRIGYWQEALETWGRRGQPIPDLRTGPVETSPAPRLDTI